MSGGMELSAHGLASKWGFNDGDMPDELWDMLDDAGIHGGDWHRTLRRVVRDRLVPLLPPEIAATVYDSETTHNPVRTDYWGEDKSSVPDIAVTVTWAELFEECLRDIDGSDQ